MTPTLDEQEAAGIARRALVAWGAPEDVEVVGSPLTDGWRFRVVGASKAGADTSVGTTDVAVRAGDGAIVRVPAGATDRAATRLLRLASGPARDG